MSTTYDNLIGVNSENSGSLYPQLSPVNPEIYQSPSPTMGYPVQSTLSSLQTGKPTQPEGYLKKCFGNMFSGFLSEKPLTLASVKDRLAAVVKKAKAQDLMFGSYSSAYKKGLEDFVKVVNAEIARISDFNGKLQKAKDIINDFAWHKDVHALENKPLVISALQNEIFNQFLTFYASYYRQILETQGTFNFDLVADMNAWYQCVNSFLNVNWPFEAVQAQLIKEGFGDHSALIGHMNALYETTKNLTVVEEPQRQFNEMKWKWYAYFYNIIKPQEQPQISFYYMHPIESLNLPTPSAPPPDLEITPIKQLKTENPVHSKKEDSLKGTSLSIPIKSESQKPSRNFTPAPKYQPLNSNLTASFDYLFLRHQIQVIENIQKLVDGSVEKRIEQELLHAHLKGNGTMNTFNKELEIKLAIAKSKAYGAISEMTNKAAAILQAKHIGNKSHSDLKPQMEEFIRYANSTGLFEEGLFHGCIYNEAKDAKVDIPEWDREWGKWHVYDDADRFFYAFDRYKKIYLNY